MPNTIQIIVVFFSCIIWGKNTLAHEFWIEPNNYQSDAQSVIRAKLINGEHFRGTSFHYNPYNFQRLQYSVGNIKNQPIYGKRGQKPAISISNTTEGLLQITYQSIPFTVTYKNLDTFVTFAEHKNFANIHARHQERQLPEHNFKESYVRFAKSLVGIGTSHGADKPSGLLIEIIALDNPYTAAIKDNIRLQLLYQGKPKPDTQIEVFEKISTKNNIHTFNVFTNEEGISNIQVKKEHQYLFNAVILREPSKEFGYQPEVVWETLWASLTLYVP